MTWLDSYSAFIFEQGDVSDIMIAIFDPPMVADRGADVAGRHYRLACIQRGFADPVPISGLGVFAPGETSDPSRHDDQSVPFGIETPGELECFDSPMFLSSVSVTIDGFDDVGRGFGGANGVDLAH